MPSPTEPEARLRISAYLDLHDSPRDDSDAAFLTAGFLALGSSPQATFPVSQWFSWPLACRLQLRGQPRSEAFQALNRIPFESPRGAPSLA